MANPLSTKQITAMETIASYTTQIDKEIILNMNSLMGSIETTNLPSTRAVIAQLQVRGFIKVKGNLKEESPTIFLTKEGSEFLLSKKSFQDSDKAIEEIIENPPTMPIEVIESVIIPTGEPEELQSTNYPLSIKPIKEVKIKTVKETKEKVEHKDEDGNFCPKKGDDEKGSKSWNVYNFLRTRDEEGNPPSNKTIENRMKALGGFHTVYYSEIERIKSNYVIKLKD